MLQGREHAEQQETKEGNSFGQGHPVATPENQEHQEGRAHERQRGLLAEPLRRSLAREERRPEPAKLKA